VFSNATLHWLITTKHFLTRVDIAACGRLVISCGGQEMLPMFCKFSELASCRILAGYFDFHNPTFYGDQDYSLWLEKAGFNVERLELVPTDMTHPGKEGLAGWIRTTWMPFTQYVSESKQRQLHHSLCRNILKRVPLDQSGLAHVRMVRLEVSALKS